MFLFDSTSYIFVSDWSIMHTHIRLPLFNGLFISINITSNILLSVVIRDHIDCYCCPFDK